MTRHGAPPSSVRRHYLAVLLLTTALVLLGATDARAEPAGGRDVVLATTTSVHDSGLLEEILLVFQSRTGYRIKIRAVGSGQALALAERGDADVVLAHAPELEKQYVERGALARRRLVMINQFLIVGPADDPAEAGGAGGAVAALARIAASGSPFVSRGDDSGTHLRELRLWEKAGVRPQGEAYLEAGQGMGASLMIASVKQAYILTDPATFEVLRPRLDLAALVEDDPALVNVYSVLEAVPERTPEVNAAGGRAFADFLVSEMGQLLIADFGPPKSRRVVFVPVAGRSEEELLAPGAAGEEPLP
jgi:tungstate transport system substrate-binding protein